MQLPSSLSRMLMNYLRQIKQKIEVALVTAPPTDAKPRPSRLVALHLERNAELVNEDDMACCPGDKLCHRRSHYCRTSRLHSLIPAFDSSLKLFRESEFETLVDLVVQTARSLMDSHTASLCLLEDGGSYLRQLSGAGHTPAGTGQIQPVDDKLIRVLRANQTIAIESCSACALHAWSRQCLIAPLRVKEGVIGALCIGSDTDRRFDTEDTLKYEMFAKSVAVAVNSARLKETGKRKLKNRISLEVRRRLAADLHDGLAQTLSLLSHKIDRVERLIVNNQLATSLVELERAQDAITRSHDEVRMLLGDLHQSAHVAPDLTRQIGVLIENFRNDTAISVNSEIDANAALALSAQAKTQALHIVNESLINIRRHARARNVQIRLVGKGGKILFQIEDDGIGFVPKQVNTDNHLGLAIMEMRADRCGGHLTIDSVPGVGTEVVACFPIADSDNTLDDDTFSYLPH